MATKSGFELPKNVQGATRVEWFDDRFYKLILPADIDESYIRNIPPQMITRTAKEIAAYLPSVTTIRSNTEHNSFLLRWRGDVGNVRADQIMNDAAAKGSRIHAACDMLVNGVDIIYQNPKNKGISDKEIEEYKKQVKRPISILTNQDEMLQVYRFKQLLATLNPEIKETENTVFNLEECYAGTLDQLWSFKYTVNSYYGNQAITIPAGLYIVDFKTGKTYDEKGTTMQLAAYKYAHHYKDKIVGSIGIHLSAAKGAKLYVTDNAKLAEAYDRFLNYKKIFFLENDKFAPKDIEVPLILSYEYEKK